MLLICEVKPLYIRLPVQEVQKLSRNSSPVEPTRTLLIYGQTHLDVAIESGKLKIIELINKYIPTLYVFAIKSIRKYEINTSGLPEMLL